MFLPCCGNCLLELRLVFSVAVVPTQQSSARILQIHCLRHGFFHCAFPSLRQGKCFIVPDGSRSNFQTPPERGFSAQSAMSSLHAHGLTFRGQVIREFFPAKAKR